MRALGIVPALMLLGCATTRTARLYDLDHAGVLTATFIDSGSGHGPISLGRTNEDGQATECGGEFVTVPQGSTGWGTIFHSSGRTSTSITTIGSDDQPGQAVVTCADGVVIECEYVTSAWSGRGHGACRDNRAHRYRLMF